MAAIERELTRQRAGFVGAPKEPESPRPTGLSFKTIEGRIIQALSGGDKLGDHDANAPGLGDVIVSAITGKSKDGLAAVAGVEAEGVGRDRALLD